MNKPKIRSLNDEELKLAISNLQNKYPIIKGPLISEHGYILSVKSDSQKEIIIRTVGKVIGWLSIPEALYGTWHVVKIIL